MQSIRQSITEQRFPQFVQEFMNLRFPDGNYDSWAVDALASVNITLKPPSQERWLIFIVLISIININKIIIYS